ncbi:unnamed protein product [Phytomonas sp. Hart1]|nr:unnamed protein product [Phytomonas sp. Hart1]|eukprot:CCW70105.1 unnamed protein product [Phytomonas sp. isolate Hart1]
MKDKESAMIQLRARIKRKRTEAHEYLNCQFYDRCHDVLLLIEKIDSNEYFKQNPSSLPQYSLYVKVPMYWESIRKKLKSYNYTMVSEFIEDMRLVINNGYAYNGLTSDVSPICRDIELVMEDLFIKELNAEPPNISELRRMGTKLDSDISKEIWKTICFYEKKDEKVAGTRASISLAQCRTATLRRIWEIMKFAGNRKKQKPMIRENGPKRSSSVTTKESMQLQQPASKKVSASPQTHENDKILKDDSPTPTLERVPQNARSDNFTVREISLIRMEDDGISSNENDMEESPTFEPE